jgi:hypothetical protein
VLKHGFLRENVDWTLDLRYPGLRLQLVDSEGISKYVTSSSRAFFGYSLDFEDVTSRKCYLGATSPSFSTKRVFSPLFAISASNEGLFNAQQIYSISEDSYPYSVCTTSVQSARICHIGERQWPSERKAVRSLKARLRAVAAAKPKASGNSCL